MQPGHDLPARLKRAVLDQVAPGQGRRLWRLLLRRLQQRDVLALHAGMDDAAVDTVLEFLVGQAGEDVKRA